MSLIVLLVWIHTLSDFFLQTDRVAKGKSGSTPILLLHILIYSLPFLVLLHTYPLASVALFILVNAFLHFVTDYWSSRLTTAFWKKEMRHEFFCTIGVDQAIHITCLILTANWFLL
jgi:hypothetical protein